MGVVVVTPPATEPVSVAEAAALARVPADQDAAIFAALIAAAREIVEARTGLALVSRRVRETRAVAELDEGAFAAAFAPVRQIYAARWTSASGASGALTVALAAADPPGRVRATPPTVADAVEIEMQVGFGAPSDVPAALRHAVLDLVLALYLGRGEAGAPVLTAKTAALLAPFVRRRAP
ncbi:MAG: hypothetical protein KJS97_08660 [Alphaproteobacteria bacterium]|nr:hypothetical protein [Alphaproteobacteria bacterium]